MTPATMQVSTVFWIFVVWDALILFILGVVLYYAIKLVNLVIEIKDDNKKSMNYLKRISEKL